MINIGEYNRLEVIKHVEFGVYLNGGEDGEILLPKVYVPEGTQVGDLVHVFIYTDSEDRLIATTLKPLAKVGDFAYMEVISTNTFGAFLKWGLTKDLMVPFREQKADMKVDHMYVVYVYLDKATQRVVASAKVEKFIDKSEPPYQAGQQVNILVYQQTDLGYKAIIDNQYMGMLYKNELNQEVKPGDQFKAYIKSIRNDHKIDLILYRAGYQQHEDISEFILNKLDEAGGYLEVTDKSPAELIYKIFGLSKKNYKMGVGELYKKRIISIEEKGIRIIR